MKKSVLAVVALLLAATQAAAETIVEYPSRPVTIVVASAPAGASDYLGRLLADELGKKFGKPFVVLNKPGAASIIGVTYVAKSAPDGYTIGIVAPNSHAINPQVYKSLTYDHVKDFAPISLLVKYPNLLVVNPKLGVKNVPELIALLKNNPNKYKFASSGVGSSIHFSGELFKLITKTEIIHVPYKGSGPMLSDLIGGHVDMSFDNIVSSLPYAKSGELLALGVTSPNRAPTLPDIPAISEYVPGFEATSWHGVVAPAGTPKEIVEKLNRALVEIMRGEGGKKLTEAGAIIVGSRPEAFADYLTEEAKRWAPVVDALGMRNSL